MLRLSRVNHNIEPVEFIYDGVRSFKRFESDVVDSSIPVSIKTKEGVRFIQSHAFGSFFSLKDINITQGVVGINAWALCKCANMDFVTLPNSLELIAKGVFSGCHSLKSINIPEKVKRISEYTFYDCICLKLINLSDNIKYIGDCAFYNCVSLRLVHLPHELNIIKFGAFWSCVNLCSMYIPDSVSDIEGRAFYDCENMFSINLPASINNIGEDVFDGCDNLKLIIIPDDPKFDVNNIPDDLSGVTYLKQSNYELIIGGKDKLDKLEKLDPRAIDILNKIIAFEYLNSAIEKEELYKNNILKELDILSYKERELFCNIVNISNHIINKFADIYINNKEMMPNIRDNLLNNQESIIKYFKSFEIDVCKLNIASQKKNYGDAISIFYNYSINQHVKKYGKLVGLFNNILINPENLGNLRSYVNKEDGNKRVRVR